MLEQPQDPETGKVGSMLLFQFLTHNVHLIFNLDVSKSIRCISYIAL